MLPGILAASSTIIVGELASARYQLRIDRRRTRLKELSSVEAEVNVPLKRKLEYPLLLSARTRLQFVCFRNLPGMISAEITGVEIKVGSNDNDLGARVSQTTHPSLPILRRHIDGR